MLNALELSGQTVNYKGSLSLSKKVSKMEFTALRWKGRTYLGFSRASNIRAHHLLLLCGSFDTTRLNDTLLRPAIVSFDISSPKIAILPLGYFEAI